MSHGTAADAPGRTDRRGERHAGEPSIIAVATAARRRHGPGIAAVLFYGSCLRRGDDVGAVVDLYLLADSYDQIHPAR